ncbi:MAG: YkgJ family cysteine cluster protein [Promethearchaeota archaeon]
MSNKKNTTIYNFECQRCGKCCSLYCIPCTDKDIHRILDFLKLTPERASDFIELVEPEDDILDSYADVPKILVEDIISENLVLVIKSDAVEQYCYFYDDDKKCTIYPARPLVCRFFPFVYEYEEDSEAALLENPEDITFSNYEDSKYCKGLGKGKKIDLEKLKKVTVQTIQEDLEYEKKVKIWNIRVLFNQIKNCEESDFLNYILESKD